MSHRADFVSWAAYTALQERLAASEARLTNLCHAASAVIDTWADYEEPTPLDPGLAALAIAVNDTVQGKTLPLVEAVVRGTGEVVWVPALGTEDTRPEIVASDQARRLARLGGLGRAVTRPDDGVDRHAEHERLRRLKEGQ